jgi:anti-sigma factor RsiW
MTTNLPVDDELVAYLDGELDAEGAARVERRLADDPEFRARLSHLQKAWDMLDSLSRSEARDDFARSTVEMVAIRAKEDAQTGQMRAIRRRSFGWVAVSAAVLLAAALGYAVATRQFNRPNRELISDLPVIERLDEYRSAESVEFVQKLQAEGLFAAEVGDGP